MLGAETKPSGLPTAASTRESETHGFWNQIIEPVEPFLKCVATQLAEQVQAFEPEIAAYAHYALGEPGKTIETSARAVKRHCYWPGG